jgi:hypothetical protein
MTIPEAKDMEFKYCILSECWGPYENNKGGFIVSWGIDNFGVMALGTTTFCIKKDGTLKCDEETCSREFVNRVLTELTKRATLEHEGPEQEAPIKETEHGKIYEF